MINVGEEWVYRQRDSDPIQRVRIREQVKAGQHPRYDVEFLDGDEAGQVLEIPARRLQVRWEHRAKYEAELARLQKVQAYQLTKVEALALNYAFDHIIPAEVADRYSVHADGVICIYDRRRLEEITTLSMDEITRDTEWFEEDDCAVVSGEGGLRIAEAACRANPATVLDKVHEDEMETRANCRQRTNADDVREVSPEVAWRLYREHYRHVYELLRQWCGHRAVTAYERIQAAEAEVYRLDELLDRVITTLEKSDPRKARSFAEERDWHQIRPENYRPVVDRPLRPDELPVRVEYRPRWWGRS